MKIEKIEVIQCRIPFFKPFVRSQKIGTINDCTAILVKVVTDGGQTGIGETNPVIHLTSEDAHMVNHVLHARLSPALLGADPRNIQKIHAIMDDVAPGLEVPKAAIDMACYDILGKSAGLCTGDLLGGVLHDKLPIMWTVGMGTPEENAQEAQQMKEKGFTSLMIKVAAGTVEQDVARVFAIRESVGPEYPLIADANQGWNVLQALRFIRLVEPCRILLLEQPVPADDMRGLCELRRRTDIMISADESIHTLPQAMQLIENRAVDVFSIKVVKHGGIRKANMIMRYAAAHGILCLMNSNAEGGVTQAASLQLGACAPNLWPYGHAYRSPLRTEADITTFSDHIQNGWVEVPREPGLGVRLKDAEVERYMVGAWELSA